jgi:hypothetical protein
METNNTMRRVGLSPRTQQLVAEVFGGDYEEAQYVATRVAATTARTPGWVQEVVGRQRTGWRDSLPWWTTR